MRSRQSSSNTIPSSPSNLTKSIQGSNNVKSNLGSTLTCEINGLVSVSSNLHSTILTEDMILSRSGAPNLDSVTHLNVWGKQLEDISILSRTLNLQIVSLSFNRIPSLSPLSRCNQLRELYVRHNFIGVPLMEIQGLSPKQALMQELQHLSQCFQLTTLWLCENPCVTEFADQRLYRAMVVKFIPSIKRLDDIAVSVADRSAANQLIQLTITKGTGRSHPPQHHHPKLSINDAMLTSPTSAKAGTPTSRPPTPYATSHDDAVVVRSRGRSPARPNLAVVIDTPAFLQQQQQSTSGTPIITNAYSPQDIRSTIPPQIPVVHSRNQSRSRSRSRSPTSSLMGGRDEIDDTSPVSPGGECYSPQDVRRLLPPNVPVLQPYRQSTSLSPTRPQSQQETNNTKHSPINTFPISTPISNKSSRPVSPSPLSRSIPVSDSSEIQSTHRATWSTTVPKSPNHTATISTDTSASRRYRQASYGPRATWSSEMQVYPIIKSSSSPKLNASTGVTNTNTVSQFNYKHQIKEKITYNKDYDNVLFAVLSLVRELDERGLNLVEQQVRNVRRGNARYGV